MKWSIFTCHSCAGNKIELVDKKLKIDYEPIRIMIYKKMCCDGDDLKININNKIYDISNIRLTTSIEKKKLVLTTLFKYDSLLLIKNFLSYYRHHGIEHFHLYITV